MLRSDPACARPLLESAAAVPAGRGSGGEEISGSGLRRFGIATGERIADTAAQVGTEARARLLALLAR